jgi:SAM-dependent methyltransferase
VVTILGVIEHLHGTPRLCLQEINRVLTQNGKLIIDTLNSVNLKKRMKVFGGRSNYPNIHSFYYSDYPYRSHIREYTMNELDAICRWSGFKVISRIFSNELYQYHTVTEDGQRKYEPYFKFQSMK